MADNNYLVTRSTTVKSSAATLYERIIDLKRWQSWSPWEDLDPNLERVYSDDTSGPGATYEWSGNRKAGAGQMTITGAEPDRRVDFDLRFLKPFKSESRFWFDLDEQGDNTNVTWTLTGPQTLMGRIMGIFTSMDKMVGPDFEKGLTRLKAEVES